LNYLAHAYLSFNHPEILMGNMISDFVKGNKKFNYPPEIQKGIMLHRAIDEFTDAHPATRLAKNIFRPAYRLYSGAFTDVVYDHFLATDKNEFTEESLFNFSQQVYNELDRQTEWMPGRFAMMFPYMKSHNWLLGYRTLAGTAKSCEGVVRRAAYLQESETAYRLFNEHYQLFGDYYRQFWADLRVFARDRFDLLNKA
jgi:acyl carrier protein phosphodiesterase